MHIHERNFVGAVARKSRWGRVRNLIFRKHFLKINAFYNRKFYGSLWINHVQIFCKLQSLRTSGFFKNFILVLPTLKKKTATRNANTTTSFTVTSTTYTKIYISCITRVKDFVGLNSLHCFHNLDIIKNE